MTKSKDIEDGTLFGDGSKKPVVDYDGSCHCGQIEWSVRLENPQHILCHCDTCKKLGGGAFSCNQIVHKVWKNAWITIFRDSSDLFGQDDLKILKGTPKIYTYTGASGENSHFYCS